MEAAEIEKFVGDLEIAVDRLRSLYEQYFMGIEKIEPMVPRKDVDRRIQALRKEQIRNTAQRFRFQMVLQRYNTYQTHWQRICREIENGTYIRHLIKAKRRFGDGAVVDRRGRASMPPASSARVAAAPAAPGQAPPAELAAELAALDREFAPIEEIADDDLELVEESTSTATVRKRAWRKAEPAAPRAPSPVAPAVGPVAAGPRRPAQPGAPAVRAPVPGPAASPPAARPALATAPRVVAPVPAPRKEDLPDERVRQLYAQYVETKRKQNESTAAITYDAIAKSLRDSSAKLREKHGKNVDFEVAIKDGKTVLKPVLK